MKRHKKKERMPFIKRVEEKSERTLLSNEIYMYLQPRKMKFIVLLRNVPFVSATKNLT